MGPGGWTFCREESLGLEVNVVSEELPLNFILPLLWLTWVLLEAFIPLEYCSIFDK